MPYYGLFLNMMRGNSEDIDLVATAQSPQALINWMEQFRVEPYTDGSTSSFGGTLRKTFAPGSPLEYYNPPPSLDVDGDSMFGEGIRSLPSIDEYLEKASMEWHEEIGNKRID